MVIAYQVGMGLVKLMLLGAGWLQRDQRAHELARHDHGHDHVVPYDYRASDEVRLCWWWLRLLLRLRLRWSLWRQTLCH